MAEGKSYKMAENPPPPISWEEYEAYLLREWPALLNSNQQKEEKVFQDFLERHPCLLPESYSQFQRGAHGPRAYVIYSQPELPGFRKKIPDFMYVSADSGALFVMLIEIEAPAKRWATKDGNPTADFTQAHQQLRQWKAWFSKPANVLQFRELYGIDDDALWGRQFKQKYVLIYGRRAELRANEAFAVTRENLASNDEILMTFDRLAPSTKLDDCVTVRLGRGGANTYLDVKHVPPTFRLGPDFAAHHVRLTNRENAIRENPLITDERKRFLIGRLPYWDNWVKQPREKKWRLEDAISGRDCE